MFCENCGCNLNNDAKFCPKCGTPVSVKMDGQKAFENVKAKDGDDVDIMPKNSMINESTNGLKKEQRHQTRRVEPGRILLLILFVVCICGISAWRLSHAFSTEIEETGSDVSSEVISYTDVFEGSLDDDLDAYLHVIGTVTDSITGNKLSGVSVIFLNEDGDIEKETLTDENGVFFVELKLLQRYEVVIKADGYKEKRAIISEVGEEFAGQTAQFDESLEVEKDDEIETENPDG